VLPAIALLLLLATPAPLTAQVPVIKKVLQFEHGWAPNKVVLIVASTTEDPQALEALAQFSAVGLTARIVTPTTLAPGDDVLAVYLSRSVPAERISSFVRTNHYLSVTWRPEDVEDGRASLCVGRGAADKPEILVNLTSLKAEGRMINARVLRMAQVIP
jgi:hypothetical protein